MTDLIHRLKAAPGPSRELDAEIAMWFRHPHSNGRKIIGVIDPPHYTESIGVALTLLTWKTSWNVGSYLDQYVASVGDFTEPGVTPAIALVIAIMKAKERKS
jgi:hypothetical protein